MNTELSRRNFLSASLATGACCAVALCPRAAQAASSSTNATPTFVEKKLEANPHAKCGLYCGSCALYQKSVHAMEPNDVVCLGCQSATLAPHCQQCDVRDCAQEKKVEACGVCPEYPCEKTAAQLADLEKGMPVIAALSKKNNAAMKASGYTAWVTAQKGRWACERCGTRFTNDVAACPHCGADIFSAEEEAKA